MGDLGEGDLVMLQVFVVQDKPLQKGSDNQSLVFVGLELEAPQEENLELLTHLGLKIILDERLPAEQHRLQEAHQLYLHANIFILQLLFDGCNHSLD